MLLPKIYLNNGAIESEAIVVIIMVLSEMIYIKCSKQVVFILNNHIFISITM